MAESGGRSVIMAALLIIGIVVGFGAGWLMAPQPVTTTTDEFDTITARGTLRVGTNSGWPPFEMFNTNTSELYGFDIDLAELVANSTYLNCTVEWVDMAFDALIGACQAGSIDMIASATFVTPERTAVLQPLEWYIRTTEVIVTLTNYTALDGMTSLDDLKGHKVGVQTGTTEDEELSSVLNATELARYDDVPLMFQDLNFGVLDAIYVDEPIVALYSSQGGYDIQIKFTVPAPPTCFYIRYGSDKLSAAINSAISDMFADGTVDALIAKWFG
ncbi:MAG: ABC transporter substrate-binding protein [Promethearchaeota archaeon]